MVGADDSTELWRYPYSKVCLAVGRCRKHFDCLQRHKPGTTFKDVAAGGSRSFNATSACDFRPIRQVWFTESNWKAVQELEVKQEMPHSVSDLKCFFCFEK